MKGKSPILTLIAGVIIAAALVGANVGAATPASKGNPYGSGALGDVKPSTRTSAPSEPSTPQPSTGATAPAVAPISRATFAGYTTGGAASIAIAIHDGVAIAYLCSGKIESWLQGKANADGTLSLTGTHHGTLTATYTANGATGQVVASGKTFGFRIKIVHAPSGLWRASAEVRQAKVVGGWIVLGKYQIGMVDVGGQESQAPPLDLNTFTAPVDGTTLTAGPIDGASGTGMDALHP